jgi:hypothetical protein
MKRRLKPRLHKRSPPPRTEENKIISTARSSSTRGGGFCLYRRGFNRRVLCRVRIRARAGGGTTVSLG